MIPQTSTLRAYDPMAVAVEAHLQELQAGGYGQFTVERKLLSVLVGFGDVWTQGENYDIALVRLAGAMLNDERMGDILRRRIRSMSYSPAAHPATA